MRIKSIVRWCGPRKYETVACELSGDRVRVLDYKVFSDAELHAEDKTACVIVVGGEFGRAEDTLAAMNITDHDLVVIR